MMSSIPAYKRCRPLLGTFVEIAVDASSADRVEDRFASAFRAIESVAEEMSFHDSGSLLSRLNHAPVGEWLPISPSLHQVLSLSLDLQERSHGVFNVAIGQPLVFWKRLPGLAEESGMRYLSGPGFELRDGEARRVLPVQIDLGGIAKGYAVDRAVESLQKDTPSIRGIVNAGGDLRVFGDLEQEVWVRSGSHADSSLRPIALKNSALATSTVVSDGRVSSYVDIARQEPMLEGRTAVVRARRCVIADALTKVVLLMPWESANELAFRYEAELSLLP